MMRVPGIPPSRTAALVESVDIFPSLAEAAAGIIIPPCAPGTTGNAPSAWLCTEGFSWVASMKAPNDTTIQKRAAFSQVSCRRRGMRFAHPDISRAHTTR